MLEFPHYNVEMQEGNAEEFNLVMFFSVLMIISKLAQGSSLYFGGQRKERARIVLGLWEKKGCLTLRFDMDREFKRPISDSATPQIHKFLHLEI